MHRCLGFALALLLAASPALAQDQLGELTLYSGEGKPVGTMNLTSMFYPLQSPDTPPPPTDDRTDARTVTVTAAVHAPDPAFVTWMMGADKKRRVTLHVQDGEGPDGSTYELQNARLTTLTFGYSGNSGGSATLTIVPDHLSVNGFQLF